MPNFYNDGNTIETALVKCDKFNSNNAWGLVYRCLGCCNLAICSDLRKQERQKIIKEAEAEPVQQSIYFDESHRLFHEFVDTNQVYVSSRESVSQSTFLEAVQRWAEYVRTTPVTAGD